MNRSSGVLLSMTSLPSPYGIGTMGKEAYQFIDFLAAARQKYWQLLPLGPTAYGDSPYASPSSFAGNPYLIDLDLLIADGLLTKEAVDACSWGSDPAKVDYGAIYGSRFRVLRLAYEAGRKCLAEKVNAFAEENADWLEDYALFMSIKSACGMACWADWPEALRMREPEALEAFRAGHEEEIGFHRFVQYLFFRQWTALRQYAKEQGVDFIGDIPIYVAMDSAEVWVNPEYFLLDEQNHPIEVAGVPPDAFTADGQLWGNPLYNYERMEADGFAWWKRRMAGAARLYDVIRIDHFRGFDSFWAVPAGDTTARNGYWRPGPGMKLVGALQETFPELELIAEDLGYTTPGVEKLLKDSGLPGMKVLHFAFDSTDDSTYLPHNIIPNSTCYLGTHDNQTTLGWVASATEEDYCFIRDYAHITEEEGWCWGMLRLGMAATSKLFVSTAQDLLELDDSARMNTPGKPAGNWCWRMLPGALTDTHAQRLKALTELYRRVAIKKAEPAEEAPTEIE